VHRLDWAIAELLEFLRKSGNPPPTADCRILEAGAAFGRGGLALADARVVSEYRARFDELLNAGYPWLNVSCYGVFEGHLVVVVEAPLEAPNAPSKNTSVNYSGPAQVVLDHGWDATYALEFAC
jgi:hypothetical protein